MSIMDIFKPQPQQQPQQQDPNQQQGQQQQPQPGNIPPTGQVPDNGVVPGQQQQQQQNDDPLANYADLWNTDPNSEQQQADAPIYAALDPTKVRDVVAKASFSGGITADHMNAIAGGGEGALQAMQQMLDNVARQVMMQATVASSKMVEQGVSKAFDATQAQLPNMLKQHNALAADPLFTNPAVKPVFEAVQQQLQTKYPDATAEQLADMAKEFITAMGQSFAPAPTQDPATPVDPDWDNFLQFN